MPPPGVPDIRAGTGAIGPAGPGAGFGSRPGYNPNTDPIWESPLAPRTAPPIQGGVQVLAQNDPNANLAGVTGMDPSIFTPQGARDPFGPQGTPGNPIPSFSDAGHTTAADFFYNGGTQGPQGQLGQGATGQVPGADGAGGNYPPGGFNIPFNGAPFPNLQPGSPGFTDPNTLMRPENFGQSADLISAAFPGISLDPIHSQFRDGERSRRNVLNALSGPLFQGNPFDLPNSGTGIGTGLNLSLQQSMQQEGRSQQLEDILSALVGAQGASSPARGGEFLAGAATDLVHPGNLDDLRTSEEARIRETTAQQNLAGQQALRDAGVLSGGGNTQDALIALQNATAGSQLDANRALTRDIETLRRQNVGAADQALRGATDIAQTTQVEPLLRLAQQLGQTRNPLAQEFIGNLFNTGQLGIGAKLAEQAQPSDNFFGNVGFGDVLTSLPAIIAALK